VSRVTVQIESVYSDGHSSTRKVKLPPPALPLREETLTSWWEEVVYPETGDGHGERSPDLGFGYFAHVVDADDPGLIGLANEWVGS